MQIRVLGDLSVVRSGRAETLPASKKTRALLGYLVATGQPHLRERLCELLWDGPDDPRAALRWSLSKLRPLVDERHLVCDRERIGFVADGVDVDLHELRAALAPDAPLDVMRAAAARSAGELLDGLDLPDCFRFHAWCAGEREAVRALRVRLLSTLVERTPSEEALKWARAWLAADPLAEAAHAAVVRCLGALGRNRDAIEQYDGARRLLAAELGARPTHELERARDEIGRTPAVTTTAPPPSAPLPTAPTTGLVGRARERATFGALVADAAAGRSQKVLLLAGEPGIGKSRLGDELAATMRAGGGRALVGRAFEAEQVRPYGAWIEALGALRPDDVPAPLRPELSSLLPELGAPPEAGDRNRLFEAVAALLRALAGPGRPLLLLLDDVHWLDESSAALLHFVARAPGTAHLLLAATARSGELADRPAVLRVLRALGRDGRLLRLDLAPLDAGEIAELARAVGAVDGARVGAESGGNPLFALEIARAQRAGDNDAETLDELLRDRLDRLGGRARDLLPFAAALGRSFDADRLARAAGLPAADLLAAVDELERHGVLRAAAVGGYDFAHDLVRQAAYRALSEPRRRLVHQRIAEVLAETPDPDRALAAERAHHAALAGDFAAAARACLAAGNRCLRLFASAEAATMAARGRSYLDRVPSDVRLELEMPLLRVAVFAEHAGARSLESAIADAIQHAESAARTAEAQLGLHLLAMLAWRAEDVSRAREVTLRSAEVARASDPATTARALATTSRCLAMLDRDMPRAYALALEADELAQRHKLELPEVPWALGMMYHYNGEHARAVAAHERAVQINQRVQDHWGACMCLLELAAIAIEEGDWAEARRRCQQLAPAAAQLGGGSEAPLGVALDALAGYGLDEPGAADALERALATLRSLDAKSLVSYVCNAAAEIDLAAGRHELARARAADARAAAALVERTSEMALADAIACRVGDGDGGALDAWQGRALSARVRRQLTLALQEIRRRT